MQSVHRNLAQQLVHDLGVSIIRGNYKVGSSLPSEADLSIQFDISRTATREAVKMLTAKGLISSRPKQGIRVSETKHWNLFDVDVLNWVLIGNPNLYLLRHFLQLRLAIEPEAAYLAAQYATQDDLQHIENALVRMKSSRSNFNETHEADIEFHCAVMSASGNPFFIQLKNFISTALQINISFTNRVGAVTDEEYQAHEIIFTHIKNKDPQAAFDAAMLTQRATLKIVADKIVEFEQEDQA